MTTAVKRRQASWALREVIEHFGFANQAKRYPPDDGSCWMVDDCYVKAVEGDKEIAIFTIAGGVASVVINDVYRLIRDGKLDDFEPEHHGVIPQRGRDPVTGRKRNDITCEIDLPDDDRFNGPAVIVPTNLPKAASYTIKSLS